MGFTGSNRLDPNLVKALMFSESEMGTGEDYKKLVDLVVNNEPESIYQLNLGKVNDVYPQTMKDFEIPVNWKENYKAYGNKNDVMLAAGALIIKSEYAKSFAKKNPKNTLMKENMTWYNAILAFKGISKEGMNKADKVWKLYTTGMHPYTSNFRLFTP